MSRRSDDTLRSAIAEIERLVFSDPNTDTVLNQSLQQLMLLLNATFGYVYCCNSTSNEGLHWEFLNCVEHTQAGIFKEKNNSCSSSIVTEALQAIFLSGRCVYGGQGIRYEGRDIEGGHEQPYPLPHYHPTIDNFLCIPLVDARQIYAVIYLCNSPDGFAKEVEVRIRPLLAAASCIVRAAKSRKEPDSTKILQAQKGLTIPHSLRNIIDSMFDPVLIVGPAEKIVACNQLARKLLDTDDIGLTGKTLKHIFSKGVPRILDRLGDGPKSPESDRNNNAGEKNIWQGISVNRLNGEAIIADINSFKLTHGGQLLRGLILSNVPEKLEGLSDYHSILQRFQVLTHLVPVGILQLNREWDCIYVNDTFCDYCHLSPEEIQEEGWVQSIHPDDANNAVIRLRTKAMLAEGYANKFRLQSPLGKITWVQVNASSLYNEYGEMDGVILAFNDITDQLDNEKRLQDIAERDQLTGLTNRAFFNDRVGIALQGVERFGNVALMFLDLDEFKQINDTYGHQAGDSLLREVGQRLRQSVRKADTIARMGGDEFTILLTNIDHIGSVTAVAEKLISAFNQPFAIGQNSFYVTCSIGIVVTETGQIEQAALLKQADIALYNAKEAGRNQYKFYTAELDAGVDVYMQLKKSLKETCDQDFHIVFQPQVDARTRRIVGLEALTRWTGSKIGIVGPDIFMKIIENSGLINDFSEWLFEAIFKQVQQWHQSAKFCQTISISINLSAKQFRNRDLANIILQCCQRYNINPSDIILEMTETAIIEDPDLALATLNNLTEMGFELSLDDFGTGYSSLAYLRDMPFHSVKIDKSFIQDVLDDDGDAKIVSSIIDLANKLDMKVIAEGVHSEAIKDWLLHHQCYLHQGFYFYRPALADDVEALVKSVVDDDDNLTESSLIISKV